MADPVRLTIVRNELEAELVLGLLRNSGILCMARISNVGFGSGGELASSGGGQRDVLVNPEDLDAARELLGAEISSDPSDEVTPG
ncbi:MAG: putative prokaryotic signal transducing protein [Thermoleophilia bacterium]|nr:putative prokaryotic signal transducing protein [Thermoleophilia bacterium]MCZ4496425.1 putative prokaryotic signal transducing protein [Thermoleophilia bacterium]